MIRRTALPLIAAISLALLVLSWPATAKQERHHSGPLGDFKHLVVIYEENHSFDNLYGSWGAAGRDAVEGRGAADDAHTVQVSQAGTPYRCLLQNDVNLASPPLTALQGCNPEAVAFPDGTSTSYPSHFRNAPFDITDYIAPEDKTCAALGTSAPATGVLKGSPGAREGGCTRDLVHRFYQEQYQLDGGHRTATSPAATPWV